MTPLRQRDPRIRDREYLGYIGYLPSVISGRWPVVRAHVRYAEACPKCLGISRAWDASRSVNVEDCTDCQGTAYRYGKRPVGAGEKPSDVWALPLTADEHLDGPDAQHGSGEREWWEAHGIDPLELCMKLRAAWNTASSPADAIDAGRRIVMEART